jgi:hypothetical protein
MQMHRRSILLRDLKTTDSRRYNPQKPKRNSRFMTLKPRTGTILFLADSTMVKIMSTQQTLKIFAFTF